MAVSVHNDSFDFKSFEKKITERDDELAPTQEAVVVNKTRDVRTKIPDLMGDDKILNIFKQYYTRDWKEVKFFVNSNVNRVKQMDLNVLPDLQYDADLNESETGTPNFVNLKGNEETEKVSHPLFSLMFFPEPLTVPNLSWLPQEPPVPPKFVSLYVHCRSLSFSCGLFEPLFCSLALYDVAEGRRVTEDFHYHLNSSDLLQPLKSAYSNHTHTRAIFNLISSQRSNENLYFVVMVYKILTGNLEDHLDIYSKSTKGTSKKNKQPELLESCARLYEFRQLAMWGGYQLTELYRGGKAVFPETISVPLYRVGNHNKKIKAKSLGSMDINIRALMYQEKFEGLTVIDPSLKVVSNYSASEIPSKIEDVNMIREIQLLRFTSESSFNLCQ